MSDGDPDMPVALGEAIAHAPTLTLGLKSRSTSPYFGLLPLIGADVTPVFPIRPRQTGECCHTVFLCMSRPVRTLNVVFVHAAATIYSRLGTLPPLSPSTALKPSSYLAVILKNLAAASKSVHGSGGTRTEKG